jgi:hypothetical protein
MKDIHIVALVLIICSLINIIWSTLLQEKIPWNKVLEWKNEEGALAFFYHTETPGSVCWFGIFSGLLISIFLVVQIALVSYFSSEETYSENALEIIMYMSLAIVSLIALMTYVMNRGLFKNSLVFLVCQYIAIGLILL